MDIMELGAIGELVGGLAVVASLIYLGLQVRGSKLAQATAAADTALDKIIQINNAVAADTELARVFSDGLDDSASLEPPEFVRFHLIMRNIFEQFDAVRLKRDAGMVHDSLWYSRRSSLTRLMSRPGVVRWWAQSSTGFSPEFRDFVAQQLSDKPTPRAET